MGEIVKEKQPKVLEKLKKRNRNRKAKERKEHLSFSYTCELMSHDGYERHRGAIAQRRWGK